MSNNNKKSKKKSKPVMVPKTIKVKKQDDPIIYPMEHYMDNKVELIPELLKKNKLEDILDQCLNEILVISKKRLLSVIDSIDTETSDDDMQSADEHNFHQEISSNSDIAGQKDAGSTTVNAIDELATATSGDIQIPTVGSNIHAHSYKRPENEDDFNDDVISLDGGDLLNEMKDHMEEYGKGLVGKTCAEEVICPDDPSEKKGIESRSCSKVSKVLPPTRRTDRVRNKTKESKRAKQLDEQAVTETKPSKPQDAKMFSKPEDGSVQKHKQIADNVQNNTD